jgi:hypothetical protein
VNVFELVSYTTALVLLALSLGEARWRIRQLEKRVESLEARSLSEFVPFKRDPFAEVQR